MPKLPPRDPSSRPTALSLLMVWELRQQRTEIREAGLVWADTALYGRLPGGPGEK